MAGLDQIQGDAESISDLSVKANVLFDSQASVHGQRSGQGVSRTPSPKNQSTSVDLRRSPGGERGANLSELMQYIAGIALLIAILLVFSVAVHIVGKLRGKK